ncbi:MAG TPA: hypothetical protein VKH45_03095 [Candidatus Acidoferrum sp.]|nr:hypothetical protein [Candidatus Acidoferrum sp.]
MEELSKSSTGMTAPVMKPSTLSSARKQYVGKYNKILCGWIWSYVILVTLAADKLSGEEMKQSEADQRFGIFYSGFCRFSPSPKSQRCQLFGIAALFAS